MPLPAKCWGVIPAAGTGARMQSEVPKQYLEVAGATVLEHSLNALLGCDFIESVVVVVNPVELNTARLPGLADSRVLLAEGGAQRSDSVLAGLRALEPLASPGDWVLVHDAARPCVSREDITALVRQVVAEGIGGILAQRVVDTVKRSGADALVVETLARDALWCAQTPQMFRLDLLLEALQSAKSKGLAITDESSAMELAGQRVQLIPGSSCNLKITVPQDLELAAFYLARQCPGSRP